MDLEIERVKHLTASATVGRSRGEDQPARASLATALSRWQRAVDHDYGNCFSSFRIFRSQSAN